MEDLNDKVTGGTLTAAEWNQVPSEIQNVIEGLGITLSSGDLNQLGKAIAGYVANGTFYTDSGAADAYVLTTIGSKQSITAYTDGLKINFLAANPNTGASTVNVAGLGVKNIKLSGGTDPAAGDITARTEAVFDLANDRFELIRIGQVKTTVVTVSDAAFAPQSDTKNIEFTAVGAGGGGGGVDGQGVGTSAVASAGGGGGSALIIKTIIDSSYNITIGAGGAGGAAGVNNGSVGGNTTIVSTNVNISANGGLAGTGTLAVSGNSLTLSGIGGTATGGDNNFAGDDGNVSSIVSGSIASTGDSGAGIVGGSKKGATNAAGFNGVSPGSGGSGAGVSGGATNFAGGNGANGIVIVKEFF